MLQAFVSEFIPAILLLLIASYTFFAGKLKKNVRLISYISLLLSTVLFIEFLRPSFDTKVSFITHIVLANALTLLSLCLLSHIFYLLVSKHSRTTIYGAPWIFYMPLALYSSVLFIAFSIGSLNITKLQTDAYYVAGNILSLFAIISVAIAIIVLSIGIRYAPSSKRKRLYRNALVTLSLAIVIIVLATFYIAKVLPIYEPVFIAALVMTSFLLINLQNLSVSSSLKSNYKMIVELSPVAIAVLDADFNILEINVKAKEMLKFKVGTSLQQYFEGPVNEKAMVRCLQTLQQEKAIHDYQLTYYLENRSEPVHLSVDAILIYVDHSHNYYFMIRDVTKEREQELLNYHLAYHDPLTDLHNRAYFVANVEKSLQQIDSSHRSALVLIDINFFKPINDTYGHQIGDLVLIHIAKVLQQHAISADIIARLGGDEFVLYYNNLPSIKSFDDEIAAVRYAFTQQHFKFDDISIEIVPSFGHATFPTDARTFEGLYHIADERMYEDKRLIKAKYESH